MANGLSESNNPTTYPLNGGIKPNTTNYNIPNNPEIDRLNALVAGLQDENKSLRMNLEFQTIRANEYFTLLQATIGASKK